MLKGPLDPAWLYHTALTLQIDLTPKSGNDCNLLPLVIALARAPLPPHWMAVPPNRIRDD